MDLTQEQSTLTQEQIDIVLLDLENLFGENYSFYLGRTQRYLKWAGSEAEIVLHNTYLAVRRVVQRGKPVDNLEAYFARALKLNSRKILKGRGKYFERNQELTGSSYQVPDHSAYVFSEENVSRQRAEELKQVIIEATPKSKQEIVSLRLDGYSYQEIADQMGKSESAVKMKIQRIKSRLKKAVVFFYKQEESISV